MGYLSECFNKYYYSDNETQKNKIKESFKSLIWGSLPYIKLDRFFKYKVSYDNIDNPNHIEIFEKYSFIEYKILKSRYNINTLQKEDLIKARINSNYGKYFDNEIYYKKEYYRALAEYKNIYFNYLKGEVDDLEGEINNNILMIENWKKESLKNKYELSWNDYKKLINGWFDRIFNNYKPLEEKVEEGEFFPIHILDWDEDNYLVGYINGSLNGYLKNYIKDLNKPVKYCKTCGIEISTIGCQGGRIYCCSCAKERIKDYDRKRKK